MCASRAGPCADVPVPVPAAAAAAAGDHCSTEPVPVVCRPGCARLCRASLVRVCSHGVARGRGVAPWAAAQGVLYAGGGAPHAVADPRAGGLSGAGCGSPSCGAGRRRAGDEIEKHEARTATGAR